MTKATDDAPHLPGGRAGLIRPSLVKALKAMRLQWLGVHRGVPGEDLQGQGLRSHGKRWGSRDVEM